MKHPKLKKPVIKLLQKQVILMQKNSNNSFKTFFSVNEIK